MQLSGMGKLGLHNVLHTYISTYIYLTIIIYSIKCITHMYILSIGSTVKKRSERPQERCNVCDLQYQHHQEFWTNCGKTQGFLAYSTCSLDVNLRKNAETRASNGACSSNSLLFAVYLHLWSTSAFFFLFFLPFWSVLFAQLICIIMSKPLLLYTYTYLHASIFVNV